jgi:hypothetical protein
MQSLSTSSYFHRATTSLSAGELTAFNGGRSEYLLPLRDHEPEERRRARCLRWRPPSDRLPARLVVAACADAVRLLRDRRSSGACRSGRWIHHRTSSLHSARIGWKTSTAYYASPKPNPNMLIDVIVGRPNDVSDAFPDARAALWLQATVTTPSAGPGFGFKGLCFFFQKLIFDDLINQHYKLIFWYNHLFFIV